MEKREECRKFSWHGFRWTVQPESHPTPPALRKAPRIPVPSTILQRIAQGDSAAVAACLDEYGGMVWGLAKRYLSPVGGDAEDAVQEIFVEVWQNAPRFDPMKGSEAAFIATIAHRRLIDRRRRQSSHATVALVATPQALDGMPARREESAAIDAAFANLLEEEREALWLSLRHGMTHENISRVLSKPLGTVKTHIRQGLARLRVLLKDEHVNTTASRGKGERL